MAVAQPDEPSQSASGVRVGQQVDYRQGRGTFAAKVIELDPKRGTVVLQRLMDKKRIERPISKVYPSGTGARFGRRG